MSPIIRMRRIDDQLMQARIALHPHMDKSTQKKFVEGLQAERRQLQGLDPESEQTDHDGIARLKQIVTKGKAFKVK